MPQSLRQYTSSHSSPMSTAIRFLRAVNYVLNAFEQELFSKTLRSSKTHSATFDDRLLSLLKSQQVNRMSWKQGPLDRFAASFLAALSKEVVNWISCQASISVGCKTISNNISGFQSDHKIVISWLRFRIIAGWRYIREAQSLDWLPHGQAKPDPSP